MQQSSHFAVMLLTRAYRTGARRFPGLINCTSVDFFHPWPKQALISVAARFLEDVELGESSVKESLAVHMAEEHLSVTKVRGRR